jgi:predicted nuclease of restriction endonuclease-like (RecB) superfamily
MNNIAKNNHDSAFAEVVQLITLSRERAYQTVNTLLIDLYWRIGEYISIKIKKAEWGDGIVPQLADYIKKTHHGLRGFTRSNLFRMRRFYETYCDDKIVSPLVKQLPWTHNLIILSQSKNAQEREFYLRQAINEQWSKRELERQFKLALFERVILSPTKASLGRVLRSIRLGEGESQTSFAIKLGVSNQYLCDLEHNRKSVSAKKAKFFADTLGYSPTQFIALAIQDSLETDGFHMIVQLKAA